jgi:hypothetical protein
MVSEVSPDQKTQDLYFRGVKLQTQATTEPQTK